MSQIIVYNKDTGRYEPEETPTWTGESRLKRRKETDNPPEHVHSWVHTWNVKGYYEFDCESCPERRLNK